MEVLILYLTSIVVIWYSLFQKSTSKVVNLTKIIVKEGKGDISKAMPLYNHLKEYRAKISVNQQEMGNLVGVSRQTISQIERGDYSPSVTLALKIAKVFDVNVESIFRYEEEKEEHEIERTRKHL